MWLINTTSLELEEFIGNDVPPYAILSHTWGNEEVSLQDMPSKTYCGVVSRYRKQGYIKILKSAAQAAADGHKYIWIDTCCIDKKSSAELSESINSMFRWYQRARVCYAFLADVPPQPPATHPSDKTEWEKQFASSRWFTRGWTLQELIAPSYLEVYSMDWTRLGSKDELQESIHLITGIPKSVLAGHMFPHEFSVAQRMSWASKRITTRREDEAYCLMGIFDINMPLLYGEGEKAFLRLQEHILQRSDDHSLFAWAVQALPTQLEWRSFFAASPAEFSEAGGIIEYKHFRTESYSITNQGLCISLPYIERPDSIVIVLLNCHDQNTSEREAPISLYLENLSKYVLHSDQEERYARCSTLVNCVVAEEIALRAKLKTFVIIDDPYMWIDKGNTFRRR